MPRPIKDPAQPAAPTPRAARRPVRPRNAIETLDDAPLDRGLALKIGKMLVRLMSRPTADDEADDPAPTPVRGKTAAPRSPAAKPTRPSRPATTSDAPTERP